MLINWRSFYTIVLGPEGRGATVIPVLLNSQWVRVEITPLVFPRPTWYRGGWMNPVMMTGSGRSLLPSRVCTLVEPSIHQIDLEHPYLIRFQPVAYLPPALIRFYRSVD